MVKDLYKILGVDKKASAEDIKKAYRKMAHQHHPDKKGGNEAKFKEVNEAYQVLSDPQKRQQYDQFGSADFNSGQGFGGFGSGQGFSGFGGFGGGQGGFNANINVEDIFDMFGDVFGGGASRGSSRERGSDIQVEVNITFKESVRGVKKRLAFESNISCDDCRGSGGAKDSKIIKCDDCGGSGRVKKVSQSFFGQIARTETCQKCEGRGEYFDKQCKKCHGIGIVKGERSFDISIPGGINDGETLLVRGGGAVAGRGGTNGDLYVVVRADHDSRFEREGDNLVFTASVPLSIAILGGDIIVPTLDGDKKISIKAGTQSGETSVLSGYGVHGRRKGDQIVTFDVRIPRNLSKSARKIIEDIKDDIDE